MQVTTNKSKNITVKNSRISNLKNYKLLKFQRKNSNAKNFQYPKNQISTEKILI